MASSTGRGRGLRPARRWPVPSASAASRSSATAPGSSPTSTWTTPPPPRWRPSSAGTPGSTTWWTTTRRPVTLVFAPAAASYPLELYPPYHAARPEVPDELQPQFEAAGPFFDALGWYLAADDAFEADDTLGSLARAEEEAGGTALIFT